MIRILLNEKMSEKGLCVNPKKSLDVVEGEMGDAVLEPIG